jgi:hypothetical protein
MTWEGKRGGFYFRLPLFDIENLIESGGGGGGGGEVLVMHERPAVARGETRAEKRQRARSVASAAETVCGE